MINIRKKDIRYMLGEIPWRAIQGANAVQEKKHVQAKHLETAKRRIRDTYFGIKERLPRRRHDFAINARGDKVISLCCQAEQALVFAFAFILALPVRL